MPEFDMQFYRRNLPHLQKDVTPHFISFVTKWRWILPPLARDLVLSSSCHDHRRKYELYAAVVMPDHVHLILTPLIDEQRHEIYSLIQILRSIKGASARAINQELRHVGHFGRKSPSTMCCGRQRGSMQRWNMFCITRYAEVWSRIGRTIAGPGRDRISLVLR
jgi:REP element-mobilizing transposase RayT